MVEAVQLATIQAGLDEREFWHSTPYHSVLRIKAAQRARLEAFLLTGWFSERFARENRLSGPQHYIRELLDDTPDPLGDPGSEAGMFGAIAADWGLEVEDGGEVD